MMLQVLVGAILVASKDYTAPRFHMFYGFLAFLTVGLAYQYRRQMRRPRGAVLRPCRSLHHGPRDSRRAAGVVMARRLRVLLVYGGRSAEHDVSQRDRGGGCRALDPDRYEIVPVAITTDGRWLLADAARVAIESGGDALPAAFAVDGALAQGIGDLVVDPSSRATFDVDVVLPLLHGPYGEDGTVQGLFELADLAVRRVGGRRFGGRDGQDHDEARVRGRAAAHAASSVIPRRARSRALHGRRRSRARVPVLREAREHGLIGRRLEGDRPCRAARVVRAGAELRRMDPRGGGDLRPGDRARGARR